MEEISKNTELESLTDRDESESARRIRELEEIEQLIVKLLSISGKAIMGLSLDGHIKQQEESELTTVATTTEAAKEIGMGAGGDNVDMKPTKIEVKQQIDTFNEYSEEYQQFRGIRLMGITAGNVPFRVITYGEAKEYENWLGAVKILREEIEKTVELCTQKMII
ncbi:7835_t:CDS:2 [Ambispora leptoticha]|uniref:7835_t:CDS:1 n=1 Tax=Ambispora leptoticha TaxID=144679 RepID=A0A9N8YSW1_9GLOM|nr:7835_t:CDS:2 [Ambispora leptoticha]